MAKRVFLLVVMLVFVVSLLVVPSGSFAKSSEKAGVKYPIKAKKAIVNCNPKAVEMRLALRDLWTGHIFWVRNVVVTTKYGDAAAAKVAEGQVVDNARSIANAVIPYYGQEAADKLFGLLAGHYGAVKEYMNAAFEDKKEEQKTTVGKLEKNVDDMATFLSGANPNWPKSALISALATHVVHHVTQIDSINAKLYASEAQIWAVMKDHTNGLADVLAEGIVKQFPMRF
jgi:hypothetical protein